MFKHLISATVLAAFAVPATTVASPRQYDRITIDVRDLDLSQSSDRTRAERRIQAAVRSLCDGAGPRSLDMRAAEASCRAQAQASIRELGF